MPDVSERHFGFLTDARGTFPVGTLHYIYPCYNAAMETEYEAKFLDVDKDEVRAQISSDLR